MSQPLRLADLGERTRRCTHCAACRTGCPTFDVTTLEGDSGRGRVLLAQGLLDGSLEPDDDVANYLATCTRCGWCETVCPVTIPIVSAIDAAVSLLPPRLAPGGRRHRYRGRQQLRRWHGEAPSPAARSLTRPTPRRPRRGRRTRAGLTRPRTAGRASLPPALPRRIGIQRHCHARFRGASGGVAALRQSLERRGLEVVLLTAPACCGAAEPSRSHDPALALEVARAVFREAERRGVGLIVSEDPGCAAHLSACGEGLPVISCGALAARLSEPGPRC